MTDTNAPVPPAQPARAPYTPPVLEPLGEWSTLTLQQTVPVTEL